MSYEIRKVANGYVVLLAFDASQNYGGIRIGADAHVFETWERASEWLRVKFLSAA